LPAVEAQKSRGVRLGLISNWDNRLRPLFNQLKLEGHFEVIVVSCEAGFSKPSLEIFRLAACELGSSEAAMLHFGDSLEMDVHGAAAAGLRTVQVVRGTVPVAEDQIELLLDWDWLR
jgi:putative hydrolase of the HAD superfamily